MCVVNHVSKLVEEFIDGISPEETEANASVAEEIEDLCGFLTDQIENGGDESDVEVIEEAKSWLTTIWNLISRGEKCKNPCLFRNYQELREHLDCLLDESRSLEEEEEGSSWKNEYLVDNGEDDFYDDSDDEFDGDPDCVAEEDDVC
jgi:hemerythrin-like domain-containing protein